MKRFVLFMLLAAVVSIGLAAGNKISGVQATGNMAITADSTDRADSLSAATTATVANEHPEEKESPANQLIKTVGNNLVPLTGIVFIFGSPIAIVLIVLSFRHKQKKAQYELIAKAIEAGKDIPEGVFQTDKREPRNNFTMGITNLFAGIGISILLWNLVALKFASIGLLISCVGIGQIIIYLVMKKSKKTQEETGASENKRLTE